MRYQKRRRARAGAWLLVPLLTGIVLFGVASTVTSCRASILGKHCEQDDECGPGFDCYSNVCTQVCTSAEECREGETCYRYHCVFEQADRTVGSRGPSSQPESIPPLPDATAAELRALRREVEMMRREQKRIADVLEECNLRTKVRSGNVSVQEDD